MENEKKIHPILRYPFYLIAICYYLTIHQILLVVVRIYSFFAQYFRSRKIRTLIVHASNSFRDSNYENAIEHCLNCINIIPVVHRGYYGEYTKAVVYLCSLYRLVGNLNEAEKYIQEASTLVNETDPDRMALYIYEGDLYADKGELKKAEEKYQKAYEILSPFKDREEYSVLCNNLYELYCELGQFDLAGSYLKEIKGKSSNIAEIDLLRNTGKLYEAEVMAKSLLSVFNNEPHTVNERVELLLILAEVLILQYNPNDAIKYLKLANTAFKEFNRSHQVFEMSYFSLIGTAYLMLKQYSLGKDNYKRSLNLCIKTYGKVNENYLKSLQNLALLNLESRNFKESESMFEESMVLFTELIKRNFLEMTYNERLSLSTVYLSYSINILKCFLYHSNYSQVFIKRVFDFWFNSKGVFWAKHNSENNMIDIYEKIKHSSKNDEIMVVIIRIINPTETEKEQVNYIYIIVSNETNNCPKIIIQTTTLKNEKENYEYYLKNIKNKSLDLVSYDRYLGFIEKEFHGKKRINFVLYGIYEFINIGTLITRTGKYFAEEFDIFLYNDIRDYIKKEDRCPKIPKEALVMANPIFYNKEVYSRDKTIEQFLPSLKGTEKEAEAVKEVLLKNKCNTTVFYQDKVTKDKFKEISKYQILHLATHGYFGNFATDILDAELFMRSSRLFLSHPFTYSQDVKDLTMTEEGILSSKDITEMELKNLELVTLSACKSGLGVSLNSGHSFSFVHAFFSAGVLNLIVSLWDIDDNVSCEFMKHFYTNWMKEGNKDVAFVNTQRYIRNKYIHPFYWGGFILIHK